VVAQIGRINADVPSHLTPFMMKDLYQTHVNFYHYTLQCKYFQVIRFFYYGSSILKFYAILIYFKLINY